MHAQAVRPMGDSGVPEIPPTPPTAEADAREPRPAAKPFYLPINPFRGLVCLGVVVFHLHGNLRGGLRELFGPGLEFALLYLRLGVESFLLLGGFFVAHMLRPSKANFVSVPRLFARRFLRLAIPYWVVIGLAVLGVFVVNGFFGRSNPVPLWTDVFAAVAFAQDIFGAPTTVLEPLWSMAPLFQYFALSMTVYWVVRRVLLYLDRADYQALTRRVIVAACVLVVLAGPNPVGPTWQLPRWGCVLALGSLAYWFVTGVVGWWFAAALAWFVVAALTEADVMRVKAAVAAVLLVAFGRGMTIPDSAATRGLAWVGHRSYSVYLIHGFVGGRVISASLYRWPDLRADPWVCASLFAVAVAASLVAGAVFYAAVERPVTRLASGIEYRR